LRITTSAMDWENQSKLALSGHGCYAYEVLMLFRRSVIWIRCFTPKQTKSISSKE
jgi:hypothetical protein